MRVLSLFDGISCGQYAFGQAGIFIDDYYASEIDKHAISVTKRNYPHTIQLGDITKLDPYSLPIMDIVIGGSPCQSLSMAGDGSGFSGKSKLFWEFVRILHVMQQRNPNLIFLLENVCMKKEWENIITEALGVQPILINSALVSAQTRKRLYWTNIEDVTQPKDALIKLKDIIQTDMQVNEKYMLSEKEITYMNRRIISGQNHWDIKHFSDSGNDKSSCVVANFSKGVPYNVLIDREKSFCITASVGRTTIREYFYKNQGGLVFCKNTQGNLQVADSRIKVACVVNGEDKSEMFKTMLPDGVYVARKFTPIECERLQTLPDNYTGGGLSDTQRYKCIGNGWNVATIAHIFSHIK